MALPAGVTGVTVTFSAGSFAADGGVGSGSVIVSAPTNVLHIPSGEPIWSGDRKVKYVNGVASFTLCPTDQPGLSSYGWTYTVYRQINGARTQPTPFSFIVAAAGPSVIDGDALTPVPSSAGTPVSALVATSVNGKTGTVVLSASDVGADAAGAATASQAAAIAAAATDATTKANAAQASAVQRANHTGTQVAATISDLGTAVAADATVRAALVPKWKASTAYASGEFVLNPSGQIVSANTAFTSGTTYNSANWTVVSGGGAVSDATTSAKGIVQLAGDLGGTAAAPTVPGKANLGAGAPDFALLPPQGDQTMWVQSFAAATVTGAASSNVNDTTNVLLGSQSATMTTDGAATFANLSLTGLTAIDLTGRYIKAWVKVDTPVNLSSLKVILGTGGFSNTYNMAVQLATSAGTAGLQVIQAGVWTPITLGWAEAVAVGSPSRTSIDSLRIQAKDTAAGAVTINVAGVAHLPEPSAAFPSGVVTLCFDDGYASQFSTARPYLDKYGMVATAMPIVSLIDSGASWMTTANLRELQDKHGWEIAGHAYTQADHDNRLTSLTTSQLQADFAGNRTWLQANGFRGTDISAWPGGIYNDAAKQTAKSYWAAFRGVLSNTHETFPPADPYLIRGYPVDMSTGGPTLSQIEAAVDAAKANKGWLVLVLHDIQASATAGTIQWSTANFQALIDYIAASGMPVRTMGDVLREKRTGAPTTGLSTLTDVALGTKTAGDVLTYDSTLGKWKNAQPAAGAGGGLSAVDTVWSAPDSGYVSWTEDPVHCNATIALASGQIFLQKLKISQTSTISQIIYWLQTAGAGLTAGQNFVGLYDAAGNRLGVSGDMTSAWSSGAGAFVVGTLGAPVTITVTTTPVYVYAAALAVGTTPPVFLRGQNILNATTTNAGLTAAQGFRFALFGTGQTALPATIALTSATANANPVLALLK